MEQERRVSVAKRGESKLETPMQKKRNMESATLGKKVAGGNKRGHKKKTCSKKKKTAVEKF